MLNTVLIIISAILILLSVLWLRRLRNAQDVQSVPADAEDTRVPRFPLLTKLAHIPFIKKLAHSKVLAALTGAVGGFLLLSRLLDVAYGPSEADFGHFSIFPDRVDVFGLSVGVTVVYTWAVMAVLIILAVIIRLTVFRNPSDVPTGAQNVIETIVDIVSKYTHTQAHGTGELLSSYILTIGSMLVMCALLELFRLRAPTSDITITFSLAFMTFIIINVYGIKRKGVLGRLKSLASPTPIVFPFRLISEIAIPVSLACRLFGNMLGGIIVVDLLYSALGNNAVGIPGVLGLYFNAFHPLIQTFIFVTLTLTFINEAIE